MSMKERARFGVKIDLKKMLKGANTKLDQENSVDVKPADLESGIEIQQR